MRTPLVMGNWKMNGSAAALEKFLSEVLATTDEVQAAICPPALYLRQASSAATLLVGAQDVSAQMEGAYTGELSANMLKEAGCTFAIVGHSERRDYHGESNQLVADKAAAAVAAGITPVFCVGETLAQREAGEVEAVIAEQLAPLLAKPEIAAQTVVAYEPVWAIGTGKTASNEDAQAVHAFIRSQFAAVDGKIAAALKLLYGGSVKPDNAAGLFSMPDIDGALVGGASLEADSFNQIIRAAA